MNQTYKNNNFSIDSQLGDDDFMFSEIQAKKSKPENFSTGNSIKEENIKAAALSKPTSHNETNTSAQTSGEVKEKSNEYGWIVPALAGAGCTLVFQKIKEEFFSPKPVLPASDGLSGQNEPRRKSRVVEDEKEKRRYRDKYEDETGSTKRLKELESPSRIEIDENKYSECEYLHIPQDLIIAVVQICNESGIKLLLHNASERNGTIRAQILYEYKNSYAKSAIAEILKAIKDFGEYYYFIPA